MKKSLLLSGLALTALAASASAADSTTARFFKPQTVSFQYYMPHTSTWGDMNVSKYTYNTDGSVATMDETGQKTAYSYNEDGMLTKVEVFDVYNGATKPVTATEYEYDPIVKDFVISETEYFYQGQSEPLYTTGNGTEITRDAAGNVTKVRTYNVSNGNKIYDDEQMTVAYDKNGTATTVTIEKVKTKNGQTVTEIEEQWKDIEWNRTDGQILSMEYDDEDADMYFSANRVASATVTSEDFPSPVTFTATYDGDSYNALMTMGEQKLLEIKFDCIDRNDVGEDFEDRYSYDATVYEAEYDENNGRFTLASTTEKTESNRADAFGINTLSETSTTTTTSLGSKTETEWEKTEVTYDNEAGYPIQAAKWKKTANDADYKPISLTFYSDYVNVDPAEVTALMPDQADATAEYFDMQGVRVANPTDGLYICRQGNSVRKVRL